MVMLSQGSDPHQIPLKLHRSDSTITREIERNKGKSGYSASNAQELYELRRLSSHRHRKLDNPELFSIVQHHFLDLRWSPEQISESMNLNNPQMAIGRETIYRGIYSGLFDSPDKRPSQKGAKRYLRHKGKPRHKKGSTDKRGLFPVSNDLTKRPEAANTRSRIGDWEADTVIGKKGKHA